MNDEQVPSTPVRPGNGQVQPIRVTVVGFHMSFLNLVGFFIKATLAAIPAALILGLIWAAIAALFFGGFFGRPWV